MKVMVYILFRETNSGSTEGSDGYVEAVYATEAMAEAERLRYIRHARDCGEAIWWDPDNPDEDGPLDWTHDWSVLPEAVLDAPAPDDYLDAILGVKEAN